LSDIDHVSFASGRDLKAENQCEGFVHSTKLIGVEAPSGASQALRVYDRGLLDQHPGLSVVE
jgi:hypothetical protein